MLKKTASSLLAASLAFTGITAGMTASPTVHNTWAVENNNGENDYRYFYQQLTPESKVFYDAIYQMYSEGILKTGTESLDMVAEGYIDKEIAENYAMNGGNTLANFGAARDAFYMDYTDVFYVDFSSLSLRVTSSDDGYHIYLGTGRYDNYYAKGFESKVDVEDALAEYNSAVDSIASAADAVTAEEGKDLTAEKVRFVHDYIIYHTTYRLEDVCKPENINLIRTSYGSLVRGEAVCEGYSRAFKAVLDRLDIPCVLVSGIYRYTADSAELHMWTDVQLDDGTWYGVDPTMDDPKTYQPTDNGFDGYECDELLLVGDSEIHKHHAASNILSEANYSFEYPVLNYDNYGESTVRMANGLEVTYDPDYSFEGIQSGLFTVSYKGMGYAKAAEQGKYIVCNMTNYYENSDEWYTSGWMYIAPEYFPALTDTDTELTMPMPHIQYVQFGVTDLAPGVTDYNGYEVPDFFYHGDPELLLASSETYYNPSGYYIAPPYVASSSPMNGYSIDTGKKYHITVTYNDLLIPVEGEEPSISFTTDRGSSSIENSKLENFEWNGDRTVSFDFTPSNMWADDRAEYSFHFNGVVGNRSHKAPYDYKLFACGDNAICAYRSQGYYWNLFGQPTLMENSDISTNGWETSDGEPISEKLTDRMVLIASSPTHQQTDRMNEMIGEASDDNVLTSQTYNIDLTICNKSVISTGSGVRVSLGFPEGYGPDDEGVTFKVYHFMRDKSGALTGVEEIPCTITKYGIVVLCKSFSPYAIVAVEDNGTNTPAEKSLVISSTKGGTITGASGFEYLSEGESLTFTVSADDGNVIDSISVNSKAIDVEIGSKTAEITVAYEDISELSGIVDIKFAAETVIEKELERGETAVQIDSEAEPIEDQPSPEVPVTTTTPTTTTTTETTTQTTTTSTEATTETSTTTTSTTETTTTTTTTTTEATTSTTETTTQTTTAETTTQPTTTTENKKDENLPQTGYSNIYKVIVGMAALMTATGAAIVIKTKKDE